MGDETPMPEPMVERMARRLFAQTAEARSGFTWPINGDWGRARDMERAESALKFVLGDWLAEHDATVLESARNRLNGHDPAGEQLQRMADEKREGGR